MYNHNTMSSHDSRSRARSMTSLLCVLAASLGANEVQAFGIAPNAPASSSRSSSALEISTTIPHHVPALPQEPSLVDRLWEEVTRPPPPILVVKKKKKKRTAPPSPASDDNNFMPVDEQEVLKRKLEWAGRYTSVEALRETFGTNENKLWGDLQASTARRLYKTLLPRALLELSQLGVGQLQPQDLAPLAYQARVAAKLYARERCTVPARLGATLFDGFRQWLKYGKFQAHGMTYDQIWEKYSDKICEETESSETDVCLKILERSCVSNEGVDSLVLKDTPALEEEQQLLLERIHAQLEQDMYELLLPGGLGDGGDGSKKRRRPWSKRNHVFMVRLLARQKRRMQQQHPTDSKNVLKP